jgi:LPP20 lipoprotein
VKQVSLLLVIALAACAPQATSQKRDSKKKRELAAARPVWLSAKPNQDQYYIGIGQATKDGVSNHIQAAKKSALEDLVSEIKVNVASTSVLSTIDANKELQEKYEQIIQTTAADEIEEFEQVETWEDERSYWVYYRLSKFRYREIKEEQKRNAVTLGLDFFTKAKQSERSGDLVQALGFYFQGFRAVEKYLADPIRLEFEGKEILLTNEILSNIQTLLDKVELSVQPTEITVNRRVAESGQTVMAKVILKETKKAIAAMPLKALFEKGAGDVFPEYKTDAAGQARILLTKISSRDLEQRVGVKVNLTALAGQNASEIYTLVTEKISVPKASVLLKVQRPLVYISSIEKSLGVQKNNQQLTNRLKNFMTNAGFELTEDKKKAELWMDISSDSERGSQSGSIYIAYATTIIKVATAKDGKEIYATTLDRVKGYSLDYERSSQEAYNASLKLLENEKLPELLNIILQ